MKALYRRGVSSLQSGETDGAMADLTKVKKTIFKFYLHFINVCIFSYWKLNQKIKQHKIKSLFVRKLFVRPMKKKRNFTQICLQNLLQLIKRYVLIKMIKFVVFIFIVVKLGI